MKFPRNARISRGKLDVAPFASVLFLLAIFVMLTSLVYTPGVRLELPLADELPGTDRPTVAVAVDAGGRLYFENKLMTDAELTRRLKEVVDEFREKPTLIVQADKRVPYGRLIDVTLLARQAGISEALLATLPRTLEASGRPKR